MRKLGAVALLERDGKVLGVSRKHNRDDFGLPGGKLEEGETYSECMVRELLEETGVRALKFTLIWKRVDEEYLVHVFEVTEWEGDPREVEESAVEWITWEKLMGGSFGKFNSRLKEVKERREAVELGGGLCTGCKEFSVRTDDSFEKKGACMKKFWQDRPHMLDPQKPVQECDLFVSFR